MGIFCGKKCKCKRRCESFFPYSRSLREGCRDACKSGIDIRSKEQYIQNHVGEIIANDQYGIDIDPTNQINICNTPQGALDPACNPKLNEAPNNTPFILAGVGVILVLIIAIVKWTR